MANTSAPMDIVLNPKYESLRSYLAHLEEHFERDGHEIHAGRNVIRTLRADGLTLCVKRYAPPSFRRRVQQLFYKSSKGKKAYLSPLLLKERGFESPESVAFVRCRHGLWRMTNYFVCLLSNYRYSMATLDKLSEAERAEVIDHFARYVARLHEDGFLHRDFSSSNILFDKVGDRYHFSLVDTNKLKCGSAVSVEAGCRNLAQLTGDDAFFHRLAQAYARERGADPGRLESLIRAARSKKG